MKPKMRSAIEKITLTDATFTGEVVEPTFVNFFYGKNGSGKSTIARTIRANIDLQWQAGKSASDYDVLVYDTDFIDANLQNYGDLAGVFTVCETNIAIQKKVKDLTQAKKDKGELYKAAKEQMDAKQTAKDAALTTFQNACWDRTAKLRTVFDAAITGKKRSNLFASEILTVSPVDHDMPKLKL